MDRQAWAFALVSAAAQLTLARRRGRAGAARARRRRQRPLARRRRRRPAEGQRLTPALAAQAAERALENAHPLTHNGYKVPMARAAIRRALLAAAGQEE